MWVGVESGVNYNYTHTSRHTTHSISPCEQQEKEAHKGKQTGPNCCCCGTKGREKQQAKKAREMRAGGTALFCPLFSPPTRCIVALATRAYCILSGRGSSGGHAGAVRGKQTAAAHDAASLCCCCCCVV